MKTIRDALTIIRGDTLYQSRDYFIRLAVEWLADFEVMIAGHDGSWSASCIGCDCYGEKLEEVLALLVVKMDEHMDAVDTAIIDNHLAAVEVDPSKLVSGDELYLRLAELTK